LPHNQILILQPISIYSKLVKQKKKEINKAYYLHNF